MLETGLEVNFTHAHLEAMKIIRSLSKTSRLYVGFALVFGLLVVSSGCIGREYEASVDANTTGSNATGASSNMTGSSSNATIGG